MTIRRRGRTLARRHLRLRPAISALRRGSRPVRLGSLASTSPVSWNWGYDRGTPVDRWYIDRFLAGHAQDISGRVLEVKDSGYTDRFGTAVEAREVLDIDAGNPRATVVADLGAAGHVADASFDCFILTQTLQYVFDLPTALAHVARILRPGGVLLATMPVTSRLAEPPTDYWRFTAGSAGRLLQDAFPGGTVEVRAQGNVLSQIAFLAGLAAEDLEEHELVHDDPSFPLIVCARAVRG